MKKTKQVQVGKDKQVRTFRRGRLLASVFVNQVKHLDGQVLEEPRVSFTKLYSKHGQLKRTTSLDTNDVLDAILVLGQAREWIRLFNKQTVSEKEEYIEMLSKKNDEVSQVDVGNVAFNEPMEVVAHE